MGKAVVSNFKAFAEKFPRVAQLPETDVRVQALKRYFERGSFVSVYASAGVWPRLDFPTPLWIKGKIEEFKQQKARFAEKHRSWSILVHKDQFAAVRTLLAKFGEPLYWKHLAKVTFDVDYKQDAAKVSLPVHLVTEERWKPMIKMFVEDLDYRKQLAETVDTSIVYKNDKRVAKYADQLKGFRKSLSVKKRDMFQEKVDEISQDLEMYNEILKWAKE
ncbi:MAG TPA: hypothetical protein HA252_05850 [Candidatus Diapherotrites archaeon]|uniref:Uncharacterized protein n=1 Tax=Candidatus Iainarchaeum sp. TaxID=3101447 RepID=A0A7J4JJ72_9ARCH|nr:hypothetical protein [Candidatus Diapherotrites archaeon]HIH16900.1 hypothetical protein [Candidatus Diapherotrites archaeon]